MKNSFRLILLIITGFSVVSGQFKKGAVEISLTGFAGSEKISIGNGPFNSESRTYIVLSGSVGYYIADRVSIEPQIELRSIEKLPPCKSVIMNITYTRCISDTSSAFFAKAGYGLANAFSTGELWFIPFYGSHTGWDVRIFSAGIGVKIMFNSNFALRCEFNYRMESAIHRSPYSSSSSNDLSISNTVVLLGCSVLL